MSQNVNRTNGKRNRWRFSFRLSALFLLIGLVAAPLGWWSNIHRRAQEINYWRNEIESVGGHVRIRKVAAGPFGYGPQLDEVTNASVLNWLPENEQKVIDGLNAFGSVSTFSVGGEGFSENSLRRLQDVPSLESLTLYGVGVRDFDALPSRVKESVRSLEIDGVYKSDGISLAAIGDCQQLTDLRLFDLTFDRPCKWVKQLTVIETIMISGSTGVSNVIPYLRSPKLTTFLAPRTDLQDDSLASVARSPSLRVCLLGQSPLTDRGLEYFRAHPTLEELSVDDTDISDKSVAIFESLPSLKELRIKGTQISQKAIDEFRCRHPEVTVID